MLLRSSLCRILQSIVILAILPCLGVIARSALDTRERSIEARHAANAEALRTLAGHSRMQAENARVRLEALSRTQAVRRQDSGALPAVLREAAGSHATYENILLANAQGEIIASARAMAAPVTLAGEPSFFEALQTGEFVVGPLMPDPVSAGLSLPCFLPIADASGEIRAILLASLRSETLAAGLEESGGPAGMIHVRDAMGRLVFVFPTPESPEEDEYEQGAWPGLTASDIPEGRLRLVDRNGEEYVLYYLRLTLPGMRRPCLTLELSMPKMVASADANAVLVRDLLLLALVTAAAFVVASAVSERMLVGSVTLLTQVVRALTRGDLGTRLACGNPKGEMGKLALSFDAMAAALEMRDRELTDAKNTADAASQAKSEFLANMSHEIRVPMNAIIGLSHLTLTSALSPKQQSYIKKIHDAAGALLGIINDILDFSKIETGQVEMDNAAFRLKDLLDTTAAGVRQKAEEKNLEVLFGVDANVPSVLVGDSPRLGQILTNLLDNAVKFTETGEILLSCTLDAVFDERVRLCFMIKDSGIGMTEEQQNKLFTAFTQADGSITRKFGGIGLGLTLTKRLIEMMGGAIHVLSEYGKGTTITFTATFMLPQTENSAVPYTCKGDRIKILVVDDNGPARRMLQNILTNMHFQTYAAESSTEAFTMLLQEDDTAPYNIVLMDWHMPGMDGIEATRHLRDGLALNNVPLVFITAAMNCSEVLQQAEKAGAAGVIYKPIDKLRLFESLMETLRGQIAAQAECEPSLQEIALMRESVPDEAATDVSLFGEKAAPNLPGLDTRLALSRLGNNERLYAKLLKQFLAYHTDTENQFHAALDMGDATGARRIAHTLKGLAGSIGASSLANECSYLEASFTSGNPEVIRNLAKVCFTTLAKVRNILQDAFAAENEARQDLPRTPSAALSEEQQAEKARLLGTLEQYLQEYNAEAASFFSSHERELALLIPSEAYTALQSLLSRFEFEEALEVVTAMAQERNIQSL